MNSRSIQFVLNGEPVQLADCSTSLTLLDYLRSSGRTGSKEGCAEGDCGACSVAMIDRDADGKPAYRAFNSCLVPVCLMDGREIITVEGVGCPAKMHPVQDAMVQNFGSQCGYCTPGFILSLFEGYYRDDIKTPDQLDDQLCGNLCRCTGYRPILTAAIQAFKERKADTFTQRLQQAGVAELGASEYEFAGEKFFRPKNLADLLQLRAKFPEGRLIAGATEIGLDVTKRFKKLPILISTEAVAELKELKASEAEWRIGAAVTLTQIEEKLAPEFPALADMLRVFGSRQIRNRATMGGNIVTASPIGDSAPVLLALEAKVVLAGGAGERTLPVDEFFLAYRKTALQPGEILKTIIIPRASAKRRASWYKVSKRREMDISTVAGCFSLELDGQNIVRFIRLAFGGVAAMPARAKKTEAALLGKPWNAETINGVLSLLESEFTPISDARGTAEYRSGLIAGLLNKFFNESERPQHDLLNLQSQISNLQSSSPHESAPLHVTGHALYSDDQAVKRRSLEVWPVCSPFAHAKILKRDATAARQMSGIHAILLAEDVPGHNDVGTPGKTEILFADKEALFHNHIVALVVGDSLDACRAAAAKVVVEYEELKPVLTLHDALAAQSFHNEPNFIRRGEVESALAASTDTIEGEFELGGQEHFYLEMHAAWAEPGEDGTMLVTSSTQHPSEVQLVVSEVLHLPINKIVVQCPRMGGGFGGKETQAATLAALAALAAQKTGKVVRVHWNRDQDMILTGHRHPFLAKFKVGFDRAGKLSAAKVHLWSNGGWALDLSQAVTDRALFHLDNSYYLPAVEFRGQVAKTNITSNTAFRGFGGPQGMLVIEEIIDRVARKLGLPPEVVRERNLYHGQGETNTTHYGQEIEDNRIQTIWHELKKSSELEKRRQEIAAWNAAQPNRKRGIAITPVKFGISFTVTHLNQAGALVLLYQDGTVQVNHGGTEMGQGLHTNMRMIAAKELGASLENIRVMTTSTDKVPNTSATAASVGTDINGAAVKNACEILRSRLLPLAQRLLKDAATENITFSDNLVFDRTRPDVQLKFADLLRQAYFDRISLSATGYYATPNIHWDRAAGRGKPFHYFACGAAVAEVEVDGFTGMHRMLRVDILHDVGEAINEGISRGQVEGGFIQGMGWLTTEELKWDDKGRLLTHSPDTYKIPAIGDAPKIFNVTLLKNAAQKSVVYGSKAVGEPPLMLGISVREALRDAVAAFGNGKQEVPLASPATCEAVWMAIRGSDGQK